MTGDDRFLPLPGACRRALHQGYSRSGRVPVVNHRVAALASFQTNGPGGGRPPGRRVSGDYRYWPAVMFSIDFSFRLIPLMSVRTLMIRSPLRPEIRAQSSGFVVFGRSSFSLNSSDTA